MRQQDMPLNWFNIFADMDPEIYKIPGWTSCWILVIHGKFKVFNHVAHNSLGHKG
jgi:hypothetical protein